MREKKRVLKSTRLTNKQEFKDVMTVNERWKTLAFKFEKSLDSHENIARVKIFFK